MLKFMENFYAYGQVGAQLATANTNFNTKWIVSGTVPALISEGLTNPSVSRAITLGRTTSGFSRIERRFETTDNKVWVGFAFRATQRNAVTFTISSAQGKVLDLEWPNQFKIGDATGTFTGFINRTYFMALSLDKTTKEVVLRVNGYPCLTTTITADIPDLLQFIWGYDANGANASVIVGDIYLGDSSAGKYQDMPSPHYVHALTINQGAADGWAPNPASRTRVEIMNNVPPKLSEYTEADTVGAKDLYLATAALDPALTINAFAVTSLLGKTDIDDQKATLLISNGTTEKRGADFDIQIQPTFEQQVFETDVAGADWTPATVPATQFGPEIRPR